ncbi:CDP-glycerol glycerophosphotransferase family protein [Paenibacillus assamensis]|uniref:CDP-glycerol glycerophosphotransferase family protein n=1 Tax=Paenibacillus assamensis TaxID=311244 RepID=UPI00042581A0|nr:CDP-glycerol glycerophosphotransferase family protein [Paenibacillus assamensis]
MRLSQKQQILDLVATIENGVDYAAKIDNKQEIVILRDCHDGLVFLTNLMSEEHAVCVLLKQAINTISLAMLDTVEPQFYISHLEKIKHILINIKSMIVDDVRTDIEIAFMPYKVSMWDSLESIYREAEQDLNCSCYVVPIPYYEKNSEGQFSEVCYEGDQFPKDLNVVSYEKYDFENRCPDIIYIHNPYDRYNTLTMVNPRFFTDNLARYTDMLVYVPYYMAGSSEKPDIPAFPAFRNVTKIIAQSNRTKDAFLINGVGANKVLNLGSPKLDATLAVMKEHKELPVSWKETMKDKKVFLFNTGIADLLSTSSWFEQIVHVLNYFISHKKSALIWRPHPLTKVTLQTMRPHLVDAFEKMEEQLKQAANITIDYSSDIYPAVAASDAIISDYSSVMLQYIVTEKPVLGLLSEHMLEPNRYYYADYLGCYFTGKNTTVSQFVEMVENNEDVNKEERISRFINSISNADGTSGQKIHQSIKKEVLQKLFALHEGR